MGGWYLYQKGEQRGPFQWAELWQMARSGQVDSADLVWTEGMGQWLSAARVPGLLRSRWLVSREGKQRELSWEQLFSETQNGSVAREDLVWSEGLDRWQPAGEIAALWGVADAIVEVNMAPDEKRVALLTLAGADTSVRLFGRREGQWQEQSPEGQAQPCSEHQVRQWVLAAVAGEIRANPGLHAVLSVEEAVVLKGVAALTWGLWRAKPAAAFCTAQDIGRWLAAGEHKSIMLWLGGDPRVATEEHDIGQGLSGLARHGLVRLWDGSLAMLTDQGRALAGFLMEATQVQMLSVAEVFDERLARLELAFVRRGKELLLARPWNDKVLLWTMDKKQTEQVLDWAWQGGDRARALLALDEILGKGVAG